MKSTITLWGFVMHYSKARVNTREAADILRLSPRTLEIWRSRGRGPRYLKFSGKVFYNISDLEEFVNSSIVETVDSYRGVIDD